MTRGVEQQELAAELATIESLLADMPASSVLERRGLEGRSARLRARLNELHAPAGRNAEVALFFSGAPVAGVHGISADFAGPAVEQFNRLVVAKGSALQGLGSTTASAKGDSLHVTGTVTGSFGFRMEELTRPLSGDTDLFAAVHETLQLLSRLQAPMTPETEEALTTETRAFYDALKAFLRTLHDQTAVVRIVGDDEEVDLDHRAIGEAVKLLLATDVEERIVDLAGVYGGTLDFSGKFEFRDEATGKVLSGKVAKELAPATLDAFLHERCVAKIRVVTSTHGPQTRTAYTLLALAPVPSRSGISPSRTEYHRGR